MRTAKQVYKVGSSGIVLSPLEKESLLQGSGLRGLGRGWRLRGSQGLVRSFELGRLRLQGMVFGFRTIYGVRDFSVALFS